MKTVKFLTILAFFSFALVSFTVLQKKEWKVPDKYVKMKNPTKASSESISLGKSLYTKHCKSCHGKDGLGDGTKAANLKGDLGDFSSKKFQSQADGELFYKSYFGRDDMPNFQKKITNEEDMWAVINFVRSLGK